MLCYISKVEATGPPIAMLGGRRQLISWLVIAPNRVRPYAVLCHRFGVIIADYPQWPWSVPLSPHSCLQNVIK